MEKQTELTPQERILCWMESSGQSCMDCILACNLAGPDGMNHLAPAWVAAYLAKHGLR